MGLWPRSDVSHVRSDVSHMRSDVSRVRYDARSDVSHVRSDVSHMRSDRMYLHSDYPYQQVKNKHRGPVDLSPGTWSTGPLCLLLALLVRRAVTHGRAKTPSTSTHAYQPYIVAKVVGGLACVCVCVWGGANQLETTRHTCELAMDSKGLVP